MISAKTRKLGFYSSIALILMMMLNFQGCAKKGKHMPLDPIYDSNGNPSRTSRNIPSDQNKTERRPTPSPTPVPNPVTETPTPPCEVTKEIDIGYNEDITPLIQKYCIACHSTPGPLNWTQYETFFAAKEKVFNRLFNTKDMPIQGFPKPTDDEMTILHRWLELGGPKERGVEVDRSNCPAESDTVTPPTTSSNHSLTSPWSNSPSNLSTDGNNSL